MRACCPAHFDNFENMIESEISDFSNVIWILRQQKQTDTRPNQCSSRKQHFDNDGCLGTARGTCVCGAKLKIFQFSLNVCCVQDQPCKQADLSNGGKTKDQPCGRPSALEAIHKQIRLRSRVEKRGRGVHLFSKQMTWIVYCLQFGMGEKTYVGATTDFARRLRQHNDELAGGAKYTTTAVVSSSNTKSWTPVFTVQGFPTKQAALQFEWALKRETLNHRIQRNLVERRLQALQSLLRKERVTSRADLLRNWPLTVTRV